MNMIRMPIVRDFPSLELRALHWPHWMNGQHPTASDMATTRWCELWLPDLEYRRYPIVRCPPKNKPNELDSARLMTSNEMRTLTSRAISPIESLNGFNTLSMESIFVSSNRFEIEKSINIVYTAAVEASNFAEVQQLLISFVNHSNGLCFHFSNE